MTSLNNDGMSPLSLAAHLGAKEVFLHLLDMGRTTLWTWGPVKCSLYPLKGLDSLVLPRPNFADRQLTSFPHLRSALEHIVDQGACVRVCVCRACTLSTVPFLSPSRDLLSHVRVRCPDPRSYNLPLFSRISLALSP
jgi:hypothetical protein